MSTPTQMDEVPSDLTLGADFDTPSMDQWRDAVAKVLNRGRPEGKQLSGDQAVARLEKKTVDGLDIEPVYTAEDGPSELGYPGVMPFTRGTHVRHGRIDAWDVRALHEDPDPDFTGKAILNDLERGVTSLWLRLDPDAIDAGNLREILRGVMLELVTVEVSSRTDPGAAAEALLEVYAESDKPRDHLRLGLGLDPIGYAALHGKPADLTGMGEWVQRLDGFGEARAFTVDATLWNDAGAGDVHEIAWALATGVEYVRALVEQGVDATTAFDHVNFRVSAGTDEFLTIARLRALRTCWSRIGEVLGVADDHRGARQHAVTSWRNITRDDPYVNILRGTISTFSAAVGGAEAITVLPFDTAWGLPGLFSRRIARNTQIILGEESHVLRVNDPAGGSWYVESLTQQVAQAAWEQFQQVENAGGMAAYVAAGSADAVLAELNAERDKRIAHRELPITGVSEFPNPDEEDITFRPRPDSPQYGGLHRRRDSEVFEKLRDRTGAAASVDSKPAVFLACIGARRDFGAREGFAANLFHIAGLQTPRCDGGTDEEIVEQWKAAGTPVAVLCSSKNVYAERALGLAKALKEAGATTVLLAGNLKELGDDQQAAGDVIDGTVGVGIDVVERLDKTLETLGVAS